jgi:hypothetical protein
MRTMFLLLMMAAVGLAAEVKVAPEVKAKVGRLLKVEATASDPKIVRWLNVHEDLDVIESETGRYATVLAVKPGRYKIALYSDAGGPPAYCVIVAEGDAPKPPPVPDPPVPNPPDPKPPIPAGATRVLIVFETAETPKMLDAQRAIMYGMPFRGVLRDRTDKAGPDGRGWNIWDKDTDASAAAPFWQAALKRPRASVPFIHVFKGDAIAYEGPLPATVDETTALITKYAGRG